MLLSSAIKEDNALLTVDLTNPDVERSTQVVIPRGTLHMFRSLVLWNATCFERLRISQLLPLERQLHAQREVRRRFRRHLRGARPRTRPARPQTRARDPGRPARARATKVSMAGCGARRSTSIPCPTSLTAAEASYDVQLGPQSAATLRWTIRCEESPHGSAAMLGTSSRVVARERPHLREGGRRGNRDLRSARMSEPQVVTSQRTVQLLVEPLRRGPAHSRYVDAARALSVRRRSLVQHSVRSRRDHHGARTACG